MGVQGWALALALVSGCALAEELEGAGDDKDLPASEPTDLASYLASVPKLPAIDSTPTRTAVPADPVRSRSEYACEAHLEISTQAMSHDIVTVGVDDNLWPGNLLAGDAAASGRLQPLDLAPGPAVVSSTLLGGTKSVSLPNPKSSAYRAALTEILQGHTEASGSAVGSDFRIETVTSTEDLTHALNVSAGLGLGPLGLKLGLSSRRQSTSMHERIAVSFVQTSFRVSMDTHRSPAEYFAPGVSVADIEARVGGGNPPVYVQSVTYGRRIVAVFERDTHKSTSEQKHEIGASLYSVSGSSAIASSRDFSSDVKNFAAVVLGEGRVFGNMDELLEAIQEPPALRTSYPVAYALGYVSDGSSVAVGVTTEHVERTCMSCSANDESEPSDGNDATPVRYRLEQLPDSDSVQWNVANASLLPGGDTDRYTFRGSDELFAVVDPQASLTFPVPVSGVRLCMHATCESGTTNVKCLAGTREGNGCCSDGETVHLTGDSGGLCVGGDSDDATMVVVVDGRSVQSSTCTAYALTMHY